MAKDKETKDTAPEKETAEQAAKRREEARKANGTEKKPGAGFGAVAGE